jgi:NAD(P)-dependent dehydrogenase (short-subunit alcohol dehydrogenase family)
VNCVHGPKMRSVLGFNSQIARVSASSGAVGQGGFTDSRGLAGESILVNAVCPGFVATDLNNHRGVRTPAEGARSAVRMATIAADGPTGTFTDDAGPVAW